MKKYIKSSEDNKKHLRVDKIDGRYIRCSIIGDYKGYEICQENRSPNRFYFKDDANKIHYAELEEELEANIDDYLKKKSILVESAENDRHLINEDLGNFLDDLQYTYNISLPENFEFLMITDEEDKRLERWMTKYMVACEDGRETACKEIAAIVEEYVENLPVLIESTQKVEAWFVGDPDSTGRLEGEARFRNQFKSWNDWYVYFNKIVDKYWPDTERVEVEIENLNLKYGGKDRNFDKAYQKWSESAEEVEASEDGKKPFIVHYGYDSGDAESGPIIHTGWDIFYAEDTKAAEEGWETEYANTAAGYEGCWAEPATQEDVDKWNKEMKDLDNLPFE